MMRAAITAGKARAFLKEHIEIVLSTRSQRLGSVAAVDQPAPAHHGDLARFASAIRGFEWNMMLLGKDTQEHQGSRKAFASFFGSGLCPGFRQWSTLAASCLLLYRLCLSALWDPDAGVLPASVLSHLLLKYGHARLCLAHLSFQAVQALGQQCGEIRSVLIFQHRLLIWGQ